MSIFGGNFFVISSIQNSSWYMPEERIYNQLTFYVAPLRTLILHAEKEGREGLLKNVRPLISVECFKSHETGNDAFWDNNCVYEDYFFNSSYLIDAYIRLIMEYPMVFAEDRWKMLLDLKDDPMLEQQTFLFSRRDQSMIDDDSLTNYICYDLRSSVVSFLVLSEYKFARSIVYSPLPPILGLLIIFIVSLFRRKKLLAWGSFFLLPLAGLVFVAAPIAFFMYYFPVYLVGYFFLASLLALRLSHKCKVGCKEEGVS